MRRIDTIGCGVELPDGARVERSCQQDKKIRVEAGRSTGQAPGRCVVRFVSDRMGRRGRSDRPIGRLRPRSL